jgi:hypothetical protein
MHIVAQDMSHDISPLRGRLSYSPVMQSQGQSSHINNRSLTMTAPEGFSSAFDLLSLDDANVLAGLSNDGVPFFSSGGMNIPSDPNTTPMPQKSTSGSARLGGTIGTHNGSSTPGSSREAESRELSDFWRAYMRTPLTAPAFDAAPAGTLANQNLTPSANGPRRARVSSLPSVKTPTVEQQPPQFLTKENGVEANASSLRTTLSGQTGEDLQSYQAAVLARKAPMTLNLVPRKGRRDSSGSPQVPARVFTEAPFTRDLRLDVGGPQSASSLAHAFGKSDQPASTARVLFVAGRRSASATEDANVAREGLIPDKDSLRPSFKRLPSQTLGPASSKRTQLSHAGNDDLDEDEGGEAVDTDTDTAVKRDADIPGKSSKSFDNHQAGRTGSDTRHYLANRRRRMSAPALVLLDARHGGQN